MAAIKQLVFEEKRVTGAELLTAVNYRGGSGIHAARLLSGSRLG